jgi:hypothetical protein
MEFRRAIEDAVNAVSLLQSITGLRNCTGRPGSFPRSAQPAR